MNAGDITISSAAVWKFVNYESPQVRAELQSRAEAVRDKAKTLCHRATGALADSIEIVWDRTRKGALRVKIGSTLPYANVQEFDPVRGKAFLRPALGSTVGKRTSFVSSLSGGTARRGGGHARYGAAEKAVQASRKAARVQRAGARAVKNVSSRLRGYGGLP